MKPILFNTPMTKASLDGRKRETRRLIKAGNHIILHGGMFPGSPDGPKYGVELDNHSVIVAPYQKGDILYVRETWSTRPSDHCYAQPCHGSQCLYPNCDSADGPCFPDEYIYKASDNLPECGGKWRPSIHMPKEAARLFLRVNVVRAQRLQDISPGEAAREGVVGCQNCLESAGCFLPGQCAYLYSAFGELWNSTIKPADRDRYGWAANPWVWVISFERCEKPEEG